MDEASARSLLTQMQARLSRDPYEALGVGTASGPGEVRSAFLALTKQFHPAKFARMVPEVQKLANEVFLALRAASDTISRPVVTGVKQTGSVPVVRSVPGRSSSPPPMGATPHAAARVPSQPNPVTRNPASGPTTSPTGPRPAHSGTTQVIARPVGPAANATQPITRPLTPAANATQPIARPATPAANATQQIARPLTSGANGAPRPVSGHGQGSGPHGTGARSIQTGGVRSPGSTPPATSAVGPRSPARSTSPPPTAAVSGTDREVAPILALLDVGQFAAAKVALESLTGRSPTNTRYKALVHYVKAREAQAANKPEDARGELLDALQIDPSFELANTALATLFSKRK